MHTGVRLGHALRHADFLIRNGVVEVAGWEGGYGKYVS